MSMELQLLLNIFVTTVPYRFLSYFPFWNHLRIPKWAVAAVIAVSEAAFLIFSLFSFQQNGMEKNVEYVFALACFVICCICIRTKITKLVFFYLFIAEYVMIIRGISVFLTGLLFAGNAALYYSWQNSLIQLVVFCLALPFMILFFRKTAERILDTDDSVLWKTIWLVPALTILIIQIFTGSLDSEITSNTAFLVARVSLLLCTFVVYYILLCSFDMLKEHTILEERAKQAEAINDMQKAQYNLMKKRIEETRVARHDLRQHLNLIQAYLENGDNEALENYLSLYSKNLPADTAQVYCNNYAVDVIVRHYAQQAKLNDIKFYSNLEYPQTLSVDEPDTCVIFGNLLENALEACQRQKQGEKFIRVCGRIIGGKAVSITIDNSCDEAPTYMGKQIMSSKRDDAGTGLLSIKSTAEKYNGITDYKFENGVFYTSVLLNP